MAKALQWAGDKLVDGLSWIVKMIGLGTAVTINEFEGIFILVALIGVYLMMSGNRHLGTKFTSLSILSYLVIRVVMANA